jgi:hypothetical protein
MPSSIAPRPLRQATPLWSLTVAGAVRGLSLARETGAVLIRDENHWLTLLNQAGSRQAQLRAPKDLTVSACSDDGSALVVGGREGDLWSLAPDLMPRWQVTLGQRIDALAVAPLGDYLAAADAVGNLVLLTRKGRSVWKVQTPRPLRFLAFVPEQPFLAGSADYGLVACFDMKGAMIWRDSPVAHAGSLAVSGDGSSIILACYTDGLHRYSLRSAKPERQPLPDPCRLASLSYDGNSLLTTGLTSSVALRDRKGRVLGEHRLAAPAAAVALGALADRAVLGTAAGGVQCIRWE